MRVRRGPLAASLLLLFLFLLAMWGLLWWKLSLLLLLLLLLLPLPPHRLQRLLLYLLSMLFFLLRLRCHLLRLHRLRSLLHTAVLCCAVLCLYMLQAAEAVDAVVLQPGPRQVLVCCTLVDGGVPGHEAGCVQGRAGGDAVVVRARWGSVGEGDRQEGQVCKECRGCATLLLLLLLLLLLVPCRRLLLQQMGEWRRGGQLSQATSPHRHRCRSSRGGRTHAHPYHSHALPHMHACTEVVGGDVVVVAVGGVLRLCGG